VAIARIASVELTDWRIRTAEQADTPSVLALWRAAESLPSVTDTEDALKRLLKRDPDSLLLAEADREIIGSLIIAWDGWRGSFYRLAVDPRWRRQGIATALIGAGEKRMRGLGAIRLTAIVVDEELVAMELWSAAGYERQAGVSRFVRVLSDAG
jgi:ribosomal protein S18 acetylase RimI-like enzyme